MSRRVLITGATGLIGRMVVRVLKEHGHHIIALSRSGGPVEGADQTIPCDLLVGESIEQAVAQSGATDLVHLAWYRGTDNRWSTPLNLDWAAASLQLVRAFAGHGGQRVVGLGSCAEYDWADGVLSEDTALRPASLYGKTKVATGRVLMDTADDLGISLVWARLFFCFGPGEPKGRLFGDVLQGLRDGTVVNCTDGLQKRDFLHSYDVARAVVTLLESDVAGAVNVASGQATSVRDLILAAADAMGRRDLIRFGAIPRPPSDPPLVVANTERLQGVGFVPKFDLNGAVQDCIDALDAR